MPLTKKDQPKKDWSLKFNGSSGWIRTSDTLINSQLRYHCATEEYGA